MAAIATDEASIVNNMFASPSDDDDDEYDNKMNEDEEEEEEEKYPFSSSASSSSSYPGYDIIETDGMEFKGLKNQGATCYLNALLQSLYFTPELREGIYSLTQQELGIQDMEEANKLDEDIKNNKYKLKDEEIALLTSLGYTTTRAKRALVKAENKYEIARNLLETNQVPSVKRILIQLREFFSLLSDGLEPSVSTKDLTNAFGWVSREVHIQHDAHELNRILIDAIERSLKGTQNEDLINSIYQGTMVSRTLCLECEYCSERTENFLDAIVQVQNIENLYQSFSKQCKSEYLVGDNKYFCEKCNRKCDAKRSIAYTKLPNVLTLALNRFVFNLYTLNREKCNDQFQFPLIFDFEPFLDEKLSKQQTHRTKEDEELLQKANQEYEKEQKRKNDVKQKRLKDEEEKKKKQKEQKEQKEKEKEKEKDKKNDKDKDKDKKEEENENANANDTTNVDINGNKKKVPLAIEPPPGVMDTKITSGTHKEVAPLPQQQQHQHQHQPQHPPHSRQYNGAWRQDLPRSRSQEDQDLQRAIAESLGQVYIPPPPKAVPVNATNATNPTGWDIEQGTSHKSSKPSTSSTSSTSPSQQYMSKIEQEEFEKQPKVSYADALDMLLNGHCCFGFYDEKIGIWRSAIYMNHWDKNKTIMVRFSQENQNLNPSIGHDKFATIKGFPVENIMNDPQRFKTSERNLRDMSNVPKQKIDAWLKRQKEKKGKKENKQTQKNSMKKATVNQNGEETKIEDAKKEEPKPQPPPQQAPQQATEKQTEVEETKETDKDKTETETNKEKEKKTETETEKEETETEETKEEVPEDWTKKTDFSDIPLVGYLCDNGEVVQGDCLRQNKENGKIFVHFNSDAAHFGKKYEWLDTPNDRICPPPKTRPKQARYGIELNTIYSSVGNGQKYDMYDHGLRDERSFIKGKNTKHNYNNSNHPNNYNHKYNTSSHWKLAKCENINLESNHLYALTGVVIHRGTPHAGHYHAYLKDYMKHGKYQKKPIKDQQHDNDNGNDKDNDTDETQKFINQICHDSVWYDFNDSSVHRIPTNQVAKQYGGRDECAYMLVYRKINKETAKELMNEPNLKLPNDLIEFVKKANYKIEQERKKQEELANKLTVQIVHPNCFNLQSNKLTMNPFITSLLKKIIKISKEKQQIDKVINNHHHPNNNHNDNDNDKQKEKEKETEKDEEKDEAKDEAKEEEKDEDGKIEKISDEEIDKLYTEQKWPTNISSLQISNIVQEHYKQNSIFIDCDKRDNIDTLISLISDKLNNDEITKDNLNLHFLSIPNAFQDTKIDCNSISKLLDANIGANLDDRLYPIKSKRLRKLQKEQQEEKEEKNNMESDVECDGGSDDEYPFETLPTKIHELPFKKFDFIMMDTRTCFVWNGKDINGDAFNLKVARTTEIAIKYFRNDTNSDIPIFVEDIINVPIEASLYDIWEKIKLQITDKDSTISDIKYPVFTLLPKASQDWPDIIYFGRDNLNNLNNGNHLNIGGRQHNDGQYDDEFYSKPKFAKLLHHKINPMKRWQTEKDRKRHKNGGIDRRYRSNSDPNRRGMKHNELMSAVYGGGGGGVGGRGGVNNHNSTFWGEVILCVENAINLPTPSRDTRASQHWQESTKMSTIYIDDYTQQPPPPSSSEDNKDDGNNDSNDSNHNYEEIGSSHNPSIKCRKLIWKIPKPTSLERFFELARQRCKIPDHVEIRALRILEDERYLITFPYKFVLKEHQLVLECGRYPKFTEVYLMSCIINPDNSTSQFLPLIVDKSKSVKFVKQSIMKLFKLNPNEYKKYVCYNITQGTHQKDKCWRDALTLNSNLINPSQGTRVGIQIGHDVINKKVQLLVDTRDLSKTWDFTNSWTTANGHEINPYIQQEIGTLSIDGESDLKQLRQQIYSIQQIKKDVNSYKNILLSFVDDIHQIPLSFPKLTDGKLATQKKWSSNRSVICVEILNEEIDSIPKYSRFLHIHLTKITATLPDKTEPTEPTKTTEPTDATDKTDDDKTDKTDKTDINLWQKHKGIISYWPPDHHVRVLYSQKENEKMDKITYKELSKYLCTKYDILNENLLITMFKINKSEWIIIDDSCDETKQGLAGKPFNIAQTARHGQIFAIFDLSKCIINDLQNNHEKIEFIKNTIKYWSIPPLSAKAKFHYNHFSHQHNSNGVNNASRSINNNYNPSSSSSKSSYDRQLKIIDID